MTKMSLDDLRKLRETKKDELSKRNAEGKTIQIIVGVGTCGIAAGANLTRDAFITGLEEHKLVDNVLVSRTGCMGLCHSEPTVEIIAPGMPTVIYGGVDAEIAKVIIQEHIIGRKLLNGRILDRPAVDIV